MESCNLKCYCLLFLSVLLGTRQTWALTASSPSSSRSVASVDARRGIARNLLTIGTQIQNPELYSPQWANACAFKDGLLTTSRAVQAGEILSLYPFHALSISSDNSDDGDNNLIFDKTQDGDYFDNIFKADEEESYHLRLPSLCLDNREPGLSQFRLSLYVNPKRPCTSLSGWLGHLAPRALQDGKANCVVAPLIGATPICALIALTDLPPGAKLLRLSATESLQTDAVHDVIDQALELYASEIAELRTYMNMAYPRRPPIMNEERGVYYSINKSYPGLKSLHQDPDIWVVDNFLSEKECESIVSLSRPHLKPCLIKEPTTGKVEQDQSRTSTNANIPQSQAPTIVSKLVKLLNCRVDQLEIIQVLRYQKGQEFQPHTDGFVDGPISACGFEDSGRLVTIFCYLNTVQEGCETRFTKLGLDIQPRKGMAVIHFPNTLAFEEDEQTEHAGVPAVDEKWLLVTWVWKHARSDPRYSEHRLPLLNNGINI